MPPSYFRSIIEEDRVQHPNAITALTVDGATLARVKIFTALDDWLGLDIFRFDQQKPFLNQTEDEKLAHASIQRFCAEIQASKYAGDKSYPAGFAAVNDVWLLGGDLDDTRVAALTLKYRFQLPGPHFEPETVDKFLNHSNTMYVQFSNPRRHASQMELFSRVRGTEGVAVGVEHKWETRSEENKLASSGVPQTMLTIAASNVIPKSFTQKTDAYLGLCNLNVMRAHLDVVKTRSTALLFRGYKKDHTSVPPPASERISRAVTRVHDAVLTHFDNVREDDKQILFTLIEEHLPRKLRELALDRVQQNVPLTYLRSIGASILVSKIVYREGLQFKEALSDSILGNMALQYLMQEMKAQRLV
ncbi:hypothetical protein PF005_g8342 [Phytophthora fragariae]|uniref:Uncharacterized protein n=1 Tax=Phytophthora fragariae TaxID=53985 RepID=A0A6A3UCG7_9STRA|nr:hypothetical protein PF006_g7724 [Phytophthora fragariae]KAE9218234.1 hypothetical protein PF005_g8342 [Phytophthora fragariae]